MKLFSLCLLILLSRLNCLSQSNILSKQQVIKSDTIIYSSKATFLAKWIMITGPKDEFHDYVTIHDTLYDCEISALKMKDLSKPKYKVILYKTYLKSNKQKTTYLPCYEDTSAPFMITIIPVDKIGFIKIKKSSKCDN